MVPRPSMNSCLSPGWQRMLRVAAWILAWAFIPSAARAQLPAQFTADVVNGTSTVTVDFVHHPIRSANFTVYLQDAAGAFLPVTAPPARTYLGVVRGYPGAMAAGTLRADGTLLARVSFESGVEWNSTGGAASTRGSATWTPNWPTSANIGPGGAGTNVYAAEVGVDSSHRHFQQSGLEVETDLMIIEHSVMCANMVYLRDCGVLHRLGRVVIRGDAARCPYYARTDNLLGEVQNQWQNVLTGLAPALTHDLALVASPTIGGGVAWVGTIGDSSARYSSNGTDANGDFYVVWRHEAGHNWSVLDYEADVAEGPTINCGNALSRFSGPEQNKVVTQRNAKLAFLEPLGPYPFELPPRAALDLGVTEPETAVTLNLLGNDHDGNGDSLSLVAVDAASTAGGMVSTANATSAAYTPAAGFALGVDRFSYRIRDAMGFEAVGNALVKVTPGGELAGHWSFDETLGATAFDSSAAALHGTIQSAARVAGFAGGAVEFNATNTVVTAGALNLGTNTVTLAGWVRRSGAQNAWAGLIFSSAGSTRAGLNLGTANELRYHWNDAGNTYNFNSGLVVPDGVWSFCALVVEPARATLYLNAGAGLQSAVNNVPHAAEEFDGALSLGRDPSQSGRRFRGTLDEVHVFRRALSAVEIQALAAGHGPAADPGPRQGRPRNVEALAWTAPPSATSHAVYLGTSYRAVRDATPASPEYRGTTGVASFAPGALADGTYFWRVDESNGSVSFKGPVWHFRVRNSGLIRERWDNLSGVDLAVLTSSPAFPDQPDSADYLGEARFSSLGDNYGTRSRGWLSPPATGNYTFWLASDDAGELWLSPDAEPANRARLASVTGWTGELEWTRYPSQQSAPVPLVAGQWYYLEVLQKEGGGGDHVAVAWQGPGVAVRSVIGGGSLVPMRPLADPLAILCPAALTVVAGPGCTATGLALGQASTTGGCGPATISHNGPAAFPVGTTIVTWTAADPCGNTATCQQAVTVRDATPPTIACPVAVSTVTDPGRPDAGGVVLGTPVTADNCGVATVSNNAPARFPVGTTTVLWTAADAAGNAVTCQQLVVVRDNQAPTAPTNLRVGTPTRNSVPLSWAASTDNVGVSDYVIYRGGVAVGVSTATAFTDRNLTPNTSYSYAVRARDAGGNLSPASSTVTTKTKR